MNDSPLVSIGVPTYDRPHGLQRTLACLSAQTYSNLEILVSDNCSPTNETARVVAEAAARDARIRYFRQSAPIGASGNFRFVLGLAGGDCFMWAADDDEWAPSFVAACLGALNTGAVSAMSAFQTSYRHTGIRLTGRMPALSDGGNVAANLNAFLRCLTPSLIYGLHRRKAIDFFLNDDMFDYYDCYFVLRLIASGGVALVPEVLYTAGVDAKEYQTKPMSRTWGSGLRFLPFYQAVRTLFKSTRLHAVERMRLEARLATVVARLAAVNDGRAMLKRLREGFA